MTDWGFVIEGDPPSVNASYKIIYQGPRCPACGKGTARLAKHEAVNTWQDGAAWIAKSARPSGWSPARRTVIEVEWYTTRRHDSDNGLKSLSDAIAHGLGCDDAGFLMRVLVNEQDKSSPRTVVRIWNDG